MSFRVNFSVNNQLATPCIYAASLANRPAAGQPGRVFIDTNIPSTGMYRDNGILWTSIGAPGSAGTQDLQSVTDIGNTTDNNIVLTYADDATAQAIQFYNIADGGITYNIGKQNTTELLFIEATKLSGANEEFGIILDGPNNVLKSSYNAQDIGLKFDFINNVYFVGSTTEYIGIDTTNNTLIAGANLTTATAGGASGIHLKIKINGTDYKIELRNP